MVEKLLRKHPAERYPAAEAVLEALATPAPARAALTSSATHARLTSIAVLPFVFLSEVEDNRALSLGFADALITIFGNLEDLVVAPTSAILNYAAGSEPARICSELGVRHSLQGTVQRLGAHWRVSLQLFDSTTQKVSLFEKYDFDLDNVFEVQDEIGRRVVESLYARFPLAVTKSRDRYSSDHCRLALALDPTLPEGHLARAWILWSPAKNFQHAEAIAALEQVLALRPNLERAHNRMATICLHIGRLEEARLAHQQALRSNPRTRTGNLEYFYIYSGDFERAEEAAESWYRDRPRNMYALNTRVLTALLCGNLDLAEQRLALAAKELPAEPVVITERGMLHARRGEIDLALECVRQALNSPRSFGHTHHVYNQIACIHAVLGESDKAIEWLERSADTGFPCWPFFRIDPHLARLRDEPAFTRLMADLQQTYTALKIQRL